ncbi:MAG: hypothetical protein Q3971_02995 [Moraxella sp.]|nr:hypothetical protein [Moraxella sp.]
MYVIRLGGDIISNTDNAIIAWVNYRNALRQASLSSDTVASIELNGQTLHTATVGGKSLDFTPPTNLTLNQIICDVMQSKDISPKELATKLNEQGVAISKSKVTGWILPTDNRKHQKIQLDELYLALLVILKAGNFELGYTPNNLKKLVEMTGLNYADFVRKYKLSNSTFFGNITDIDSKNHRSMSYKSWCELTQKVFHDLKNLENNT